MDYNPFYLLLGLSSVVARWNFRNKNTLQKGNYMTAFLEEIYEFQKIAEENKNA